MASRGIWASCPAKHSPAKVALLDLRAELLRNGQKTDLQRNAVARLRRSPFGADEHGADNPIKARRGERRMREAAAAWPGTAILTIPGFFAPRAVDPQGGGTRGHKAQVVLSSPVLWNVCQRIGPPGWAEQRLASRRGNERVGSEAERHPPNSAPKLPSHNQIYQPADNPTPHTKPMQHRYRDPTQHRVIQIEEIKRLHVGVHDAIERHMAESADQR